MTTVCSTVEPLIAAFSFAFRMALPDACPAATALKLLSLPRTEAFGDTARESAA